MTEKAEDAQGNPVYIKSQSYGLNFEISGKGTDDTHYTEQKIKIENLSSLFRNTHVIINVSMRHWNDVGAYAEIVDWSVHNMNGYLEEE